MLKVGIHENHVVAPGHTQSGKHRGLLAEIPAEGGVADARICGSESAQLLPGRVPAAVVDITDFEAVSSRSKNDNQRSVESPDHLILIETRNYDRNLALRHSHPWQVWSGQA